ncbi:Glycolate dehydrogenase, iron-sulfur subunit GlcF [hydrothermal vent metagenome]|uniref:Glycolate dehydrogenase, iron-sulfur subunit GlcF n=1 Tax=hydrothermal vent metagenome TaxID=652676 RepID=A0A3B0X0R9_9ZZZZ
MKNTRKLADTDLCVMCGMCLPNCPTYQLYQTEAESPRGRIALMQAIDQQRIKADSTALLHIDHCLSCLNCETICPSRVPYGALIDAFRNQHSDSIRKPFVSKLILKQVAKLNGINQLASIINQLGLKQLISLSHHIAKTPANSFPSTKTQLREFYAGNYSKPEQRQGEVSLFIGCSTKASDNKSIEDAIFILNQLKFDVHIPQPQHCCGALHQHNGQQTIAAELLYKSTSQLAQIKTKTVLFFSPACGEMLQQSNDIVVTDARHFILTQLKQQPLAFTASAQAIALHESCSHRNRLNLKTLNADLLNCVPNMQIIKSSNPSLCCGAGGIQSINYPEQAQALLNGKLASFDLSQTNILISDNIGCSLHIKSAISAYNPNIEIMHPISFLARQLAIE